MVYIFAKTIKNIFSSFIPHETIFCDDRDPPWITSKIKNLIDEENTAYQSYIQNVKNKQSFQVCQVIQNMLLSAIEVSKQQYYSQISKKLLDSSTSRRAYWSLLKTFLINKKIPYIIINSFQTLGTRLNNLKIFWVNSEL